ncbi:M20 family metallopeptidase [Paenibacillus sp. 481]|uniref:M20 family metallopeptidase n=1 Tax=Paenibacillus sp. 481 TaxID=2835869 RepID=UPI001E5D70D4|nr:M20 family metallopeptidase [Paenibacillus sp. 481]UHA73599.1 M20 family metallopeptidase [Paenibacillus sp. 481]
MNAKERIAHAIDQNADELKHISRYIGQNPELGNEEYKASARLSSYLESHGFTVERGILSIETSFIGTYDSGKPGPTIAFLCEYDALPDIGHACGHHLICTMSIGAAIGLKDVLEETGGVIRVYGTPAEETNGAKVPMADAGMFDDCDIAMMAHPFHRYEQSGTSLAMDSLQFEFHGRTAHAAAAPHEGINALDAVIQLFNGINAMRQQVRSDARIHGVITSGGKAPNIIPDYTAASFYVRSGDRPYTNELTARVKQIAEGAAMQAGCTLRISQEDYSYDELRTNEALCQTFNRNLIENGVAAQDIHIGQDHGSLDLGNVSVRVPSIHAYMQVTNEPHALHTIPFRDAAMEPLALDRMIFTGKMLAYTAYDVLVNPELLKNIRTEFAAIQS